MHETQFKIKQSTVRRSELLAVSPKAYILDFSIIHRRVEKNPPKIPKLIQ
jgi:hypothetical protein